MEQPIGAVPFNFASPSQMEWYGKERKRQEVLDDGEGHKRQKVSDDGKEYGDVDSYASLHGESEQMKPKNSPSVTNYSDPFAVTTLLERLDCGKFGSVTREVESLVAQCHQMLQGHFVKYPKLIEVFLEGEKHQSKDSSKLGDMQPSDPNCCAIVVLEDASAENKALAAPQPVVIIDSDDEEDVGACRPLFHDIVLPKPPGELDMNDLLVRDPTPRKARKTGRPSVDTEPKKEEVAVDTEIKKDKGVYVGIKEEEGNQSDDEDDNLNDIWKEMNMALESSKDVSIDPSSEEHGKENEQDCDHSYVLKDDLGYVCRVCGVIDKGIDTIFEFQFNKVKRSTRTYVSDYRNARDRESTGKLGVELSENDLKVTEIAAHPRHMKQMKPHQVEGFNFLVNNLVSDTPGGCILAHAPGSGKTFMIISFMQSFLAKYPHARPLVVLPKGILSTWKKEFQTWQVEDIPLLDLYTGKVDNRYQQLEVLKQWVEQRSILFLGYKQFSTIVCDSATNNISASCQEILLKAPSILILDEGHTPRNENTDVLQSLAKVQTPRKVVLSGTLYQNHVKEVFNILNLVRPKFLRLETSRSVVKRILSRVQISGVRKQFKAGVDSAFYELVEHSLHKDEDFKRKVTVIHDLREMTSNVLHYYKGDFLDELPGLVDFTVVLNLSPRQKCEMDKLKKLSRKFKISSVGSAVSVHPKLNSVSELFAKTDDKVDDLLEKLDLKDGVKAKFYLNMLKLCELSDEKLLVFSQYLLPLKFLERLTVKYKGWSVGKQIFVISGETSSENREWSMERFNNSPDAKVFFGSIKACGEGISLVGASRVIILDVHLNPSVTRQAVGRAFRPGQKKKVFTYRLVAANSPEEEDHSTCFKKESIAKMWFEWNEYCGFRAFEMETVDANESGDAFFDNPMLVEDVKALYKR